MESRLGKIKETVRNQKETEARHDQRSRVSLRTESVLRPGFGGRVMRSGQWPLCFHGDGLSSPFLPQLLQTFSRRSHYVAIGIRPTQPWLPASQVPLL